MQEQTSESSMDLKDTLKENKKAAEEVEKAADSLAVVSAVLDNELEKESVSAEVNQAVKHTGEIGKRLDASTKRLKKVNDTLEREVNAGAKPSN